MNPLDPSRYEKADIVVREVTKGIFKILNSKLPEHKEDTYLDHIFITSLLNEVNVLILNDDSNIIHCNFAIE